MAVTVKIFGERNTGTNFITMLLAKNYTLEFLRGVRTIGNEELTARIPATGIADFDRARNKVIDDNIEELKPSLFGWKHARPDVEFLRGNPAAQATHFVCLTKNPYSFVQSLFNRPYAIIGERPDSFLSLVQTPWQTLGRDNLGVDELSSPVQLWNLKVKSYFELAEALPKVLVLRYEDLLSDPDAMFTRLDHFFYQTGLRWLPGRSTKRDTFKFSDYADKYLKFDPVAVLGRDTVEAINRELDPAVVAQARYSIVDPDGAKAAAAQAAAG